MVGGRSLSRPSSLFFLDGGHKKKGPFGPLFLSLSKKACGTAGFFYGMFFHGHVPGKNTVTRQ
ncbi:MAG: hypothetical protein Q4D08_08680, partial [Clostridia bacterium]|nr:hypothetical protein [Clostridia bacterium]